MIAQRFFAAAAVLLFIGALPYGGRMIGIPADDPLDDDTPWQVPAGHLALAALLGSMAFIARASWSIRRSALWIAATLLLAVGLFWASDSARDGAAALWIVAVAGAIAVWQWISERAPPKSPIRSTTM